MPSPLPYMLSSGLITRILLKIQEARRPDRFTQDFLETKLGFSGGSAMAAIPLLKRMGLLSSDGTPTQLYDEFRNTSTQGSAIAQGMRLAFKELFDINEFANDLPREKLASLITQLTGLEKDNRVVKAMASTFENLKTLADFEQKAALGNRHVERVADKNAHEDGDGSSSPDNVDLKLSYTINLNLPETTNPDVFNAIFRSLKENLLKS